MSVRDVGGNLTQSGTQCNLKHNAMMTKYVSNSRVREMDKSVLVVHNGITTNIDVCRLVMGKCFVNTA